MNQNRLIRFTKLVWMIRLWIKKLNSCLTIWKVEITDSISNIDKSVQILTHTISSSPSYKQIIIFSQWIVWSGSQIVWMIYEFENFNSWTQNSVITLCYSLKILTSAFFLSSIFKLIKVDLLANNYWGRFLKWINWSGSQNWSQWFVYEWKSWAHTLQFETFNSSHEGKGNCHWKEHKTIFKFSPLVFCGKKKVIWVWIWNDMMISKCFSFLGELSI